MAGITQDQIIPAYAEMLMKVRDTMIQDWGPTNPWIPGYAAKPLLAEIEQLLKDTGELP